MHLSAAQADHSRLHLLVAGRDHADAEVRRARAGVRRDDALHRAVRVSVLSYDVRMKGGGDSVVQNPTIGRVQKAYFRKGKGPIFGVFKRAKIWNFCPKINQFIEI